MEHEDEAAPNPVAAAIAFGRSSPSRLVMVSRRITAWTMADSPKPRMSAHKTAQVIDPLMVNAWPRASATLTASSGLYLLFTR